MSIEIGSIVRLEVSKIVHGGFGLARHNGQVFFCSGVLPGEVVDAVVREVKKSHCFADLVAVVSASPDRQPHMWPEADWRRPPHQRPGSADYGHIALEAQRRIKSDVLREALIRQGRFAPSEVEGIVVNEVPGESDGLHWRTRETLHVEQSVAGPRAANSHRVIRVETLPLAHRAINEAGVHQSDWTGYDTIRAVWSDDHGVIIHPGREPAVAITETVHGHRFHLDSRTFWQVHEHAPDVLWSAVNDAIVWDVIDPDKTHLDLYGGVGLFARAVLSRVGDNGSVASVESDPVASSFAARNLADYSGATALHRDAVRYLREQAAAVADDSPDRFAGSVVVVDPPRSGLGGQAGEALIGLRASQIVYVACDPVAFARDAAELRDAGYELSSLAAFDLFPHTHHMEVVAGFIRRV